MEDQKKLAKPESLEFIYYFLQKKRKQRKEPINELPDEDPEP